jgi:hypothetical protein
VNVSAGLSPAGSKPDAGVVSTIAAELPTPFVRRTNNASDPFDNVFASRHCLLLDDEWEGERCITLIQRDSDLNQVALAGGGRDQAVRKPNPSLARLHVEDTGTFDERVHFG